MGIRINKIPRLISFVRNPNDASMVSGGGNSAAQVIYRHEFATQHVERFDDL
jgi:hypothetical protein